MTAWWVNGGSRAAVARPRAAAASDGRADGQESENSRRERGPLPVVWSKTECGCARSREHGRGVILCASSPGLGPGANREACLEVLCCAGFVSGRVPVFPTVNALSFSKQRDRT